MASSDQPPVSGIRTPRRTSGVARTAST